MTRAIPEPRPARTAPAALRLALLALLLLAACTPSAAPAGSARGPSAAAPATRSGDGAATRSAGAPASTMVAAARGTTGPLSPRVSVKVAVIELSTEVGLYVAQERGYFDAEGLDVELLAQRMPGSDRVALLARGDIQFASAGIDPSLFNVAARDIPLKIVAAMSGNVGDREYRTAAVMVRQDHLDSGRYRGPADFRGMTFGIAAEGATGQLFVERAVAKGGLGLGDVTLQVVQMQDAPVALANRAIDAGWLVQPFILFSETRNVARPVVLTHEIAPNSVGLVLLASPRFTQEQPEAAARFVKAWLRGQRDYYRAVIQQEGGAEEIYQILSQHTTIKDPTLFPRIGYHGADPNGDIHPGALDEYQDAFLRYGTQQRRVDFDRLIDRTYLDRAVQELGRIEP
jgi:NitT/TauT family transport system substrate-binding protein